MLQKNDYGALEEEKTYEEYLLEFDTDSALLGNSAISSHLSSSLRLLGYPEKSIKSLERCQENTGGYYFKWCDCGKSNDIKPLKHWCNNRTCFFCAEKRKKRLRNKFLTSLLRLPQNNKISLKFLTISPQNYKNLKEGLVDIRKNFRKFLRLEYIKKRILGSIYIIEAKQNWAGQEIYDNKTGIYLYTNKEDSWNIHIHAIVYGGFLQNRIKGKCNKCGSRDIKYNYQTKKFSCNSPRCLSSDVSAEKDSRLVSEWHKCSNNQPVNMHITRQASKKTGRNNPKWTLNYMLKYISAQKDDFKDDSSEALYIFSTHKQKLIDTTGFFKGHWENKKFIPFPWLVQKTHCSFCGGRIFYMTCYEKEKAVSLSQRQERNRLWIRKEKEEQKIKLLHFKSTLPYFIIS